MRLSYGPTAKTLTAAAVVALAIAGVSVVNAQEHGTGHPSDTKAAADVRLPDGVAQRDVSDRDTKQIRDLLGSAAIHALKVDGFGDLVNHLNDQDRDRIGQADGGNDNELQRTINGRINQIRGDWKAKYGHDVDFNADGNAGAYSRVTILRGEITNPAAVVRNWPLPAVHTAMRATQDAAVDPNNGNANLEAGREIAVAVLNAPMKSQPAGTPDTNNMPNPPSNASMSPLVVSIIGEVQNWKIDVPNRIDATKLRQNLLMHLTAFGEMKDSWPADEREAQLVLTRHVTMALYDVPTSATKTTDADK
jgi:hypothetical protein